MYGMMQACIQPLPIPWHHYHHPDACSHLELPLVGFVGGPGKGEGGGLLGAAFVPG